MDFALSDEQLHRISVVMLLDDSSNSMTTEIRLESSGEEPEPENRDTRSPCVVFSGCSASMCWNHYICHVFLSDAETGTVLEKFPENAKITSVCRVHRIEKDRKWSSGMQGTLEGGCSVTGIKFVVESALESAPTSSGGAITLHCWEQSEPFPYCYVI